MTYSSARVLHSFDQMRCVHCGALLFECSYYDECSSQRHPTVATRWTWENIVAVGAIALAVSVGLTVVVATIAIG